MKSRFVTKLLFAVYIVFTAACVEGVPDARTALAECPTASTDPECTIFCADFPNAPYCRALDAGTDPSLCDGGCPEDAIDAQIPVDAGGLEDVEDVEDTGDLADASCDADCVIERSCLEGDDTCVACLADDDCPDGVCYKGASPADNLCVACLNDNHCSNGTCFEDEAPPGNLCVACLNDSDCANGVCFEGTSTAGNLCVACLSDNDCANGVCFQGATSADNVCAPCIDSSDCNQPTAARCAQGSTPAANYCAGCDDSSQCARFAGNEVCDSVTGECGAGTNGCTSDNDCAVGGTVFACDLRDNSCSNIVVGSAGECQPCVSTSSCATGNACVPLTYQGSARGYYCMPRFQPPSMCQRPYDDSHPMRQIIDGGSTRVCLFNEQLTTCEALAQFGASCPNGNECTAAGSSCESLDDYDQCTYACSRDADCSYGDECGDAGFCEDD